MEEATQDLKITKSPAPKSTDEGKKSKNIFSLYWL
jgi:hypothetical protein